MIRKMRKASNRCAGCGRFTGWPMYLCDECYAEDQRKEIAYLTQGWI